MIAKGTDHRFRAVASLWVFLAMATLPAGCSSKFADHRPGVVTGEAPICYGPGPNLNLSPKTTIRAVPKDGGSPTTIEVETTSSHHNYRISLSPGAYKIGAVNDGTVSIRVRPGANLAGVDLPSPGCL